MIRRLTLTHWKSHESTVLQFGKGTQLFVGIMGSGKTSAMDAISFALFGTFPALKRRGIKLEDVIMRWPHAHAKAEVELEFDYGGSTYAVRRTVNRQGASEAQVKKDGKLVEAQPQRATELLEGVLKTDYDLFSRVIYAEQNRIDALLQAQKGERKRQVDELLGLSLFEAARQNAGSLASDLRARQAQEERFLEGVDAKGLEREWEENVKQVGELAREQEATRQRLEQSRQKATQAEAAVVELEKGERAHYQLERKRETAQALELQARQQAGKLEEELRGKDGPADGKKLEQEWQAKKVSEQEARERHLAAAQALAATELEIADAKRREAEGRRAQEKLEKIQKTLASMPELEKEAGRLAKQVAANEAEAKELERSLASLAHASAQCPTCQAPLSSDRHRALQKEKSERLAQAEKSREQEARELQEKERLLKSLRQAEAQAAGLHGEIGKAKGLEERVSELEKKGKELAKESAEAAERMRKATREREEAEQVWREEQWLLERKGQALRLRQDEKRYRAEASDAEGALKTLSFDARQLAHARGRLGERQQERAGLEEALRGLDMRAGESRTRQAALERRKKEASEQQARARNLEEKAGKAARFARSVVETQKLLRDELVTALNHSLGEVWGVLYPYEDYRGLRLQTLEDDYALEILDPEGRWQGIEACSGGERSCAALALRVAFALVLAPGTPWLILDEPTHNLDRPAVLKLARALGDHLPSLVEQVFIVTHDESLKEGASSKTFFFEREKASGQPTRVEELSAVESETETRQPGS